MVKKVGVVGVIAGVEGKANVVSKVVELAIEDVLATLTKQQTLYGPEGLPIMVERFQGGGNAGHTFWWQDQEFKTHQIPMGIAVPGAYSLDGQKMFLDVRRLVKEITYLREERGVIVTPENFGIASNAHVTLDYHVKGDQVHFDKERHTSTGSGIQQTATDKSGRLGMRFVEFLDPQLMKEILTKRRFPNGFPESLGDIDRFVASYDSVREQLASFATLEHVARKTHGRHIWIGEGAQGAILDEDAGFYPGITSSNPTLVPNRPDIIMGVLKSYISNVGTGDRHFVSRMDSGIEKELRERWGEYGTTTGRGRELGWINLVELAYTVEKCQADYLAATCGDRMTALHEIGKKPKLVTAVKVNGKTYTEWDPSFDRRDTLWGAEPVYREFEPWETLLDGNGNLTLNADRFYDAIQEATGREIIMYGNGPKPEDIRAMKNPLKLIK